MTETEKFEPKQYLYECPKCKSRTSVTSPEGTSCVPCSRPPDYFEMMYRIEPDLPPVETKGPVSKVFENNETFAELRRLEGECSATELQYEFAKDNASAAKKGFEKALLALRKFVRDLTAKPKDLPLFDGGTDDEDALELVAQLAKRGVTVTVAEMKGWTENQRDDAENWAVDIDPYALGKPEFLGFKPADKEEKPADSKDDNPEPSMPGPAV